MTMWNWITPATLIDRQRKAEIGHMGEQARILLREGFSVEADRILDEMSARVRESERKEGHR